MKYITINYLLLSHQDNESYASMKVSYYYLHFKLDMLEEIWKNFITHQPLIKYKAPIILENSCIVTISKLLSQTLHHNKGCNLSNKK